MERHRDHPGLCRIFTDAHRLYPVGKGSIAGALILAVLFGGLTWFRMKKKQLKKPVWIEETIHPYELTAMIILVAAVFGIIGAKIFDMIEHLDDLIRDPVS